MFTHCTAELKRVGVEGKAVKTRLTKKSLKEPRPANSSSETTSPVELSRCLASVFIHLATAESERNTALFRFHGSLLVWYLTWMEIVVFEIDGLIWCALYRVACWWERNIYCLLLFFSFVPFQLRNKFMKKLPRDAEASNVLVGEVDFLDAPFVAFVRLQQAVMLGALTEVPVPTRWLRFMSSSYLWIPQAHKFNEGRCTSRILSKIRLPYTYDLRF